jgi:hypothetical protein
VIDVALDENQVSAAVVAWLEKRGFHARALTAGQSGIDVAAWHPSTGAKWAIEAKGATNSKKRSASAKPSKHAAYEGVSKALLVAISWTRIRVMEATSIAIAVPDDAHFNLWTSRIEAACAQLGIGIFLVGLDGAVRLMPAALLREGGVLVPRTAQKPPDMPLPRSLRWNYGFPPYADD